MLFVCGCGSNSKDNGTDNGNGTNNGTNNAVDERRDTNTNTVGDDVREGVDDAGNAVGDAVDDAGNAIRNGANAVTGDNNMRRSSRIRRMGRMLRRRIRKTETAWRKLCRFLCFSAPIHWGTRVASAIRPVRAAAFFSAPADRGTRTAAGVFAPNGREVFRLKSSEELRSVERGRLRRPP